MEKVPETRRSPVGLFPGVPFGRHSRTDRVRSREGLGVQPENSRRRGGNYSLCDTKRWKDFTAPGNILCSLSSHATVVCGDLTFVFVTCLCSFQEVSIRDPGFGWDQGPDLDHFSNRTRQVLQFMNPNKINMDLLVELIGYIGTAPIFPDTRCLGIFYSADAHLYFAREISAVCRGGRSCAGVPSGPGSHSAALWSTVFRQEV